MVSKRSVKRADSVAVVDTAVTHRLALEPCDWMRATWRPRQPLPRPSAQPADRFDPDIGLKRLEAVPVNQYGWWQWDRFFLPAALSRAEAHFWLVAVLQSSKPHFTGGVPHPEKPTPPEVAGRLAGQTFDGRPSLDEVEQWFARGTPPEGLGHIFQCLLMLFTPMQILRLLQRGPGWPKTRCILGYWAWPGLALDWFARDVFPYLTNEELEEARPALREQIKKATWPRDSLERPDAAFHLGTLAGLHDEMLAIVTANPFGNDAYHRPQDIVFGLSSAALVEEHARRLRLRLTTAAHVRAWLAHTELSALDYARDHILRITNKAEAASLAAALAVVKAPEVAPRMLELRLSSRAPQVARQWLDEEIGNAVAGLLPVAAGQGPLADAAIDYLRETKRKGHSALIEEQVQLASPEVADTVRRLVLEQVEKVYTPFTDSTMPPWLRTALATPPEDAKPGKLPPWLVPESLPPLAVGEHRLDPVQVRRVLSALKRSPLAAPLPLVVALREHADRQTLGAFAWRLFEAWQGEGGPTKDKWAMMALGHLGGDDTARKLATLIVAWPGEGQHKRAVLGLECLAANGSDAALAALLSIGGQRKFKALQKNARAFLDGIARARGLS